MNANEMIARWANGDTAIVDCETLFGRIFVGMRGDAFIISAPTCMLDAEAVEGLNEMYGLRAEEPDA